MTSEADLIAIVAAACRSDGGGVVTGIGDDAAVLTPPPGVELVLCTDTLVAGVHFPPGTPADAVGHKSLAVNLSDLAAMGADPLWALLAVTLPSGDAGWVRGFANGFSVLAGRFGVSLVGGDTTRGPLAVTVTVAGSLPAGTALRRSGARAGDALFVTGTLGDAALALEQSRSRAADPALRARLDRPEPRVDAGRALRGIATAAIDVSDGLMKDLGRLCDASGCGATVDAQALPKSDAFARAGGTVEMQMHGGDDYELLFTLPAGARVPAGCTRIGGIDAARGLRVRGADGSIAQAGASGYEPFA